ncbi:desulfoferrodoxin [Heliobacillus mobilis]|uniref:Desulfoferrodoxin n=1 Tax=Heliobacterium mobile TaxID=28064 RepID=A0A6I3SPF0_HELMO|nr:desulfoferrodoxin family protein [Heliobacterium mobile]MTV50930.1 desulfoferrodoxin [Heliobacterium mobile]
MANNLGIYRCSACGYSLEVIEMGKEQLVCGGSSYALTCLKADAQIQCCGKSMELLIPNTVEASVEKHLPVAEFIDNGKLLVKVGSTAHPMTQELTIQWIAIVHGDRVQRVNLEEAKAAEAVFYVGDADEVDLYAFCNLHGFWQAHVKR